MWLGNGDSTPSTAAAMENNLCWSWDDSWKREGLGTTMQIVETYAKMWGGQPADFANAILVGAVTANVLLIVLFVMHIYWFALFLRLLHGILSVGSHEAGRQEYEGDEDTIHNVTKKQD